MPSGVYKHRLHSKETRLKISAAAKGRTFSKSTKRKLSIANKGSNNHLWKGSRVSYRALHRWVERVLGRPKLCANCATTDPVIRYDWANISGEYKRSIDDWVRLCRQCHVLIDGVANGQSARTRKPLFLYEQVL